MRPVILVLRRDERVGDEIGHRLDRDEEAAFAREFGDERTVVSVNARRHRRLVFGEHFVIRQVLAETEEVHAEGADREEPHQQPAEKDAADDLHRQRQAADGAGDRAFRRPQHLILGIHLVRHHSPSYATRHCALKNLPHKHGRLKAPLRPIIYAIKAHRIEPQRGVEAGVLLACTAADRCWK